MRELIISSFICLWDRESRILCYSLLILAYVPTSRRLKGIAQFSHLRLWLTDSGKKTLIQVEYFLSDTLLSQLHFVEKKRTKYGFGILFIGTHRDVTGAAAAETRSSYHFKEKILHRCS